MNIPIVITKRLALTFLVGAGFLIISMSYFLYASDTLLLCLGSFLFVMCGIRCCSLFFRGLTGAYTVLEGECFKISFPTLSRYQVILFLDDMRETHCLHLDKNCRLQAGKRYRLYFTDELPIKFPPKSLFFKRATSSGKFLGAEEVTSLNPVNDS